MAFGALTAALDCGFIPNGIDFTWNGADEGDQVTGDGWAELQEDGSLAGEIAYHNGRDHLQGRPVAHFFNSLLALDSCAPLAGSLISSQSRWHASSLWRQCNIV